MSFSGKHHSNRPRRGFTLVELLVVVSIIALLIAILLPSLKAAREQSRMVKCLANLRAMGQGVSLYVQDQNSMLPGPLHPPIYRNTGYADPRFQTLSEDSSQVWFLLYRLAPIMAKSDKQLKFTDQVATCPTALQVKSDADFIPNNMGGAPNVPNWSHPYNYLPNSWGNTKQGYYFGWVNIGVTWQGFMNNVQQRPQPVMSNGQLVVPGGSYAPVPIDQVSRGSDEWMIGDAWWDKRSVRPNPLAPPVITMLGTWQLNRGSATSGDWSETPLPRAPYHGSKKQATNLVYFDGHGAAFKGIDNWAQHFPANRWPQQQ